MKRIDDSQLSELSAQAALSARRRKNHNLHATTADPIQRMLNAFEPATYVRPHRHVNPARWELFAILSGRAAVLTFADDGTVRGRSDLAMTHGARIVEIPEGAWHTVVSLAPQTVMLEVKAGPYEPTPPADLAAWAPAEGDPAASRFEQWFRRARAGDTPPFEETPS